MIRPDVRERRARTFPRLRVKWLVFGAVVLAMGAVAAPQAAAPASARVPKKRLAHLRAIVKHAEAIPKFVAPTAPVKAAKARGKSFVTIPLDSQIPVCAGIANDLQTIGKKLGIKVQNFANNGSPVVWAQGVEQAVHNHLNGVALVCSLNPAAVTAQLQSAKAAHIPVLAGQLVNIGQPLPKLTSAAVGQVFIQSVRVLVDDAIITNKGQPFGTLYVSSPDVYSNPGMLAAAKAEFKKQCGSACSLTVVSVPTSHWATSVESTVRSALLAHPDITAVIMPYDGAVPLALPAFQGAHRANLKVYTYGTSGSVVKLIKTTHGLIAADIGIAAKWPAYSDMDQMLRLMTGQRPMPATIDFTPARLYVPSNASQFFDSNDGAGTAYIKGYEKAWGVGPGGS